MAPQARSPPESPLGHDGCWRAGRNPGQGSMLLSRCPLVPAGRMPARVRTCRAQGAPWNSSRREPRHQEPPDLLRIQGKGRAPRTSQPEAAAPLLTHCPATSTPAPRSAQPYRQRSPAHRGSRRPASSCPPPAGHSWYRTGRSDSPAAGRGTGGILSWHRCRLPAPPVISPRPLPPRSSAARSPRTWRAGNCCCR